MPTIERLTALEILDSRGRPTVQASCLLAGGAAWHGLSAVRGLHWGRRGPGAA